MTRLIPLAAALALSGGCVFVQKESRNGSGGSSGGNVPPEVYDGYAGCAYDRSLQADILLLEAWVFDANGPRDVTQVWADIYDERSGERVESLELFPTQDPELWFSDWLAGTSNINCWYPNYSVDLVAYDVAESYGVYTVWLDAY